MREEAKRLFYINKQLASTNIAEIIQGIEKSRHFLLEITVPEYLNTLVMSLLDLFCNTKQSYIRHLIVQVIPITFPWVNSMPSRPQIITKLTDCLKSNDETVRIFSLKMVGSLHNIFNKDSSVYHLLLSKLHKVGNIKQKQLSISSNEIVKVIICLRTVLENSQYLSSIFCHSLRELRVIGELDLKIILYLCVYAWFQVSNYSQIITLIWEMLTSDNLHTNQIYRKYFKKLIKIGCQRSYKCTVLYKQHFKQNFPELEQQINYIECINFSFLKDHTNTVLEGLKNTDLLDLCYQYFSVFGTISQEMEEIVVKRVELDISQSRINSQTILLTFYLPQKYRQTDRKISKHLQIPLSSQQTQKLLKISLTCANFNLASKILQHLTNTVWMSSCLMEHSMSVCVLLGAYCDLHLKQDLQTFFCFVTVMNNLALAGRHASLFRVSELWANYYGGVNGEDNGYLVRKQEFEGEKIDKIPCERELRDMKEGDWGLKEWIPVSIRNRKFSKIYFSKQTILDIYKFL